MPVPWQASLMFVGLTGLPHPDVLHGWATKAMSALSINLDQDPFAQGGFTFDDQDQQQMQQAGQQAAQAMLIVLGTIIGLFVFSIVAMCMYKINVHDHKPAIPENDKTMASGNFHYNLFDCFSNMNECLCSCFCTSIRFADTYSSIGLGGFWCVWLQFWGLNVIVSFLGGFITQVIYPPPPDAIFNPQYQSNVEEINNLFGCLFRGLIFGVWARGKLRKRLGDTGSANEKIAYDLLSWGCCPCCALTQESVEVDIAADVSISCPWTLNKGRVKAREVAVNDDYEKMLGGAVLLEGR